MGRFAPVLTAVRKPSTVEAMQLTDDPAVQDDVIAWGLSYGATVSKHNEMVAVLTADGNVAFVMPGWYLLRGTHGEFYPCPGDIFEANYDETARSFA